MPCIKKKMLTLILLCIILIEGISPVKAVAVEFSDVKPSDWYYTYVMQLTEDGYIKGYGDGTFGAEDYMTAAQMATLLERVYGDTCNIPDSASEWSSYAWHKLDWLDGSYFYGQYNVEITRDMAAYMLFCASGLTRLYPENYGCAENISDYLFSANKYGYLIGFEDGELHGERRITRSQACAMLYRALYENPNPEMPSIINPTRLNYQLLGYDNLDASIQRIEKELRSTPTNVIDSFVGKGYTFIAAGSDAYADCFKEYCGVYKPSLGVFYKPTKVIIVNDVSESTILHEFGHYICAEFGDLSVINNLYSEESEGVVKTDGREYGGSDTQEFFADAFKCYITKGSKLAVNAPNTYSYIDGLLKII